MRVLVTGGAGLVGSHLVDLLMERGHDVRVLDSLEPPAHADSKEPPWLRDDTPFFRARVQQRPELARAMRKCDVVFHQAAVGGFGLGQRAVCDSNVNGTVEVMDVARLARVGTVVVASSQAVYGHGNFVCGRHGPFLAGSRSEEQMAAGYWEVRCPVCNAAAAPLEASERHPASPSTTYGLSKLCAEKLALQLGREFGIRVVALRYALTYGPRQSTTNPYAGICSIFAQRLADGRRPVVFEDGAQCRDFTYVGDVAAANVLAAESPDAAGVYNVGTGEPTTVLGFVAQLAEALGVDGDALVEGEYRPGDARHVVVDNERIRRDLGWEPTVGLREGLRRYVEWFRQHERPAVQETPEQHLERMRHAGVVRSLPSAGP